MFIRRLDSRNHAVRNEEDKKIKRGINFQKELSRQRHQTKEEPIAV